MPTSAIPTHSSDGIADMGIRAPSVRFMGRGCLANPDVNRVHERSEVGTVRCAVRAASSGATVPPATTRAGTSQRDVPTKFRFTER
ncbi:MAG: hypothetical protein ABI651_12825, partial [Verrucomicrobiota bacterium]